VLVYAPEEPGRSPGRRRTAAQPRVFVADPESLDMGASPKPSPKSVPKPGEDAPAKPAAPGAPAAVYWSARGSMRGRARLRLLGALRGAGALVWTGGAIAVAYELDIFGAGEARSASGALEGDFSALPAPDAADPDAPPITGARLRLEDGREIAIDLTSLEPGLVEIEAHLTAADAGLLPAASGRG
jgi:hypothetical protein